MKNAKKLCLTTALYVISCAAYAQDDLQGRAEINWRPGHERAILMNEFWVPLAQDRDRVLYGDLRTMGDDQDAREFNVGLGYRVMVDPTFLPKGVVGVHGWYDRRFTPRGSRFNQVTAGLEWFGDMYDAKINGYMPLNDQKTHTQANPEGTDGRFVGSQIVVNTDQVVVEEALKGFDIELGKRIALLDPYTDSTRFYMGGYHFEGKQSEDVSGWRARVTSDLTPNFQIGARFQSDDVRGSQGFLEATFRFPFNHKKSYRKEGLRARLDESPERDIDIVSNEAITDDGFNKVITNTATGSAANVIHVDNTATGAEDGSADNPYNTLAEAMGVAGDNDLVYVHRGDGTNTGLDGGILMDDDGQKVIGAGTHLYFSDLGFSTSNNLGITASDILIAADSQGAPVLEGAGDTIRITADDTVVAGFDINGTPGRVFRVINANNALVSDLENLVACSNNCVRIDWGGTDTHALTVRDLRLTGNDQYSQFTVYPTDTSVNTLTIENSTFDNSKTAGFIVLSRQNAQTTVNFVNTTVSNSGGNGALFIGNDNSTATINWDRTSFTGSDDNGIVITANNTSEVRFKMESSTITQSDGRAIIVNDGTGTRTLDLGGGTLGSTGNNAIYNNDGVELEIDIDGGTLKAQNNYWGSASGLDAGEFTSNDGSTIDASQYLTTRP